MRLCFYCGQAGHIVLQCHACRSQRGRYQGPGAAEDPQPTPVSFSSFVSNPLYTIMMQILHSGETFLVPALIDSGSEGNFIDQDTMRKLHLQLRHLHSPPRGDGTLRFSTEPITLHLSFLHNESISFLVTNSPKHPIILSTPWLHLHNPVISWTQGR